MAIQGCNLNEIEIFINEVSKVRERLRTDNRYLSGVLNHNKDYEKIKSFFVNFVSFLRYFEKITVNSLYRVRKCNEDKPYVLKKDLIYPPPSIEHEDRMNNILFRVLYTSFHEFTAMAETRIDASFKGKYFQLTRFKADKPINVFKLGLFSDFYLNSPRDSEHAKKSMEYFLGSQRHDPALFMRVLIEYFGAIGCQLRSSAASVA